MFRMGRWLRGGLIALAVAAPVAYFGLGAVASYRVDDDIATATAAPGEQPIHVARTIEAILAREIEHHNWQPNDPWFYPTAFTDNGRNYQLGVLQGLRRSLLEYATRTIRARKDGAQDPDLREALNQLQYPPDIWVFDINQGIGVSSTGQYANALAALRQFEQKTADPTIIAELRSEQLFRMIDALRLDLNAHVIMLQRYAASNPSLFDDKVDDLFYQTKGVGFVYAALAPALKRDFAPVIQQKRLQDLWTQLEAALGQLAQFKPRFVLTGAPESSFLPNHLIVQAFYASRCVEILSRLEEAVRS